MADYINIGQVTSSDQTLTDQIVAAYRNTQQPRINTVKAKKTELEQKQAFFNTINSKMNALISQLDKFGDYKSVDGKYSYSRLSTIDDSFAVKTVTSSNTEYITASASSDADMLNLSTRVNRLATNDALLTDRMTLEDEFVISAGTAGFDFTVNGTTTSLSIDITEGDTNETVMNKIVDAINSNEDIGIRASLIKDTTTTGRLSFTSKETGADNKIIFSNSDVLKELGLKNNYIRSENDTRRAATTDSAGYRTASATDLNSEMLIDGVTVSRSTNVVDDAIEGVTFNLNKAMSDDTGDINLETDVNTKAVEDLINPLLNNYNNVMTYLNNQNEVRRSESSISSLYYRMRDIPANGISTENTTDPRYLADLGIETNSDGTLALTDKEKLKNALLDDPVKVSNVFNAENGFVSLINEALAYLKGEDGILMQRKNSLIEQIEYQQDRIKTIEDSVNQQAESLRKEYTAYLKSFYEAQNQYSLLQTMPSGNYGGYTDLLMQSY